MAHRKQRRCQRGRRGGMATLEFVLVLPVLLFLFLLIFSFANTRIGQARSMVQSKNKAWKARHGATGAFAAESVGSFDPGRQLHRRLGRGSPAPGVSRRSHETPVSVAWFLSPPGRAAKTSHAVLGGAYDHRSLRFDEGRAMAPSGRLAVFADSAGPADFRGSAPIEEVGEIGGRIWERVKRLQRLVKRIRKSADDVVNARGDFLLDEAPRRLAAAARLVTQLGQLGVQVPIELTGLTTDIADLGRVAPIPNNPAMPGLGGLATPAQLVDSLDALRDLVRNADRFGKLMDLGTELWREIGRRY